MAVAWFWTYTRGSYFLLIAVLLLMPLLASRIPQGIHIFSRHCNCRGRIGIPIAMGDRSVADRLTNDKTAVLRVVLDQSMMKMIRAHPCVWSRT